MHTPQPWVLDGYRIFGPVDARSKHANGRTLIGGVVDDLNDWRGTPSSSRDERAEFNKETAANARLIASAPDLLAVCKAFMVAYSDTARTEALGLAAEVIAKAEGR